MRLSEINLHFKGNLVRRCGCLCSWCSGRCVQGGSAGSAMMMARPCFVALLCVALWCGVVFGQEKNDATDAKEDTTVDNDASPDQQPPKEMVDEAASSTTSSTTTTTEGSNAAPGEASPSDGTMEKEAEMEGVMGDDDDDEGDEDENEEDEGDEMEEDYVENEEVADAEASSSTDENGAATLSVSLSSLMLATLLAKVYAH
ncbi:nucleoplasmin-like protein ANO39 isoform X3 [Portunus trituberculatus]|uniref:nucleoplasmin-like protein ANO39 isoform X3 n=1 Tax=Portunus trituberculatus TaxID=210409 RepID=UPI001E1CC421|nr:nucleoplasmin-like protein ANO39 isoform X3 [Portunus trituberculatus]